MTINMMVITKFDFIIPLRLRLICIKRADHWKDNSASLDKLLDDDLNGFSKWSVLTLGLIVKAGRLTLESDIVTRLGLIVGVGLSVEYIFCCGGFGRGSHSLDMFSIGDSIIDNILIFGPKFGIIIVQGGTLIIFFIVFSYSFLIDLFKGIQALTSQIFR